MAKMCPMEGCKGREGMCMHDWMMVAIAVIVVVAVAAKVAGLY